MLYVRDPSALAFQGSRRADGADVDADRGSGDFLSWIAGYLADARVAAW